MIEGVQLQGRHESCASVQSDLPQITALTHLMPFEMPGKHVTWILKSLCKIEEDI